MFSERTRASWAVVLRNPGIIALLGALVLLWPAALLLVRTPQIPYAGLDGSLYQFTIATFLHHAPVFAFNAMNMFQGLGAPLIPMNVWLNPGYFVFSVFDPDAARIASTVFFLGAYCGATFLLARTVGLSAVPAVFAAQLTAIAFPPFQFKSGLDIQFVLNPGVAYPIALVTIALCLLLRVSTASTRAIVAGGLGIAWVYAYSVFCDPFWTPVISLAFVVPALVMVIGEGPPRVRLARVGAVFLAVALLHVLGVFDYVLSLVNFTARQYFHAEVRGAAQTGEFASILFQNNHAKSTYRVWIWGWALASVFGTGRQRLLGIGCIAYAACLVLLSAVYLLVDINWTFPLPLYFEQSVYHLFTLTTVVGWVAFAKFCVAQAVRVPLLASLKAKASAMTLLPVACLMVVPAFGIHSYGETPEYQQIYRESPPPDTGHVGQIQAAIKLGEDAPFRGVVAMPAVDDGVAKEEKSAGPVNDAYSDMRVWHELWTKQIATLEMYGQTIPPPYYYLVSRLLNGPNEGMGRNVVRIAQVHVPLLRAMGVKYVLSRRAFESPAAILKNAHTDRYGTVWRLYEMENPNVGHYSPLRARVSTDARESIDIMRRADFDFEHDAVTTRAISESLTPARNAGFAFRNGAIHVWGESDGHSLLVLPLQYSRCLKFAGDPRAEIMRVDLALTGVQFSNKLDAAMLWDFGVFSAHCRRRDLQDLQDLKFESDPARRWRGQNPYAVVRMNELALKLKAIRDALR